MRNAATCVGTRVAASEDQPWRPFQCGFLRLITSSRFFRRITTEPGFLANERIELRTFIVNLVPAGEITGTGGSTTAATIAFPGAVDPGTSAGLTGHSGITGHESHCVWRRASQAW